MQDPKLGPESRAAVFRAVQRLAWEQSVEESVNVNAEAESASRQICPACGNANRRGNNFCASCGVALPKTSGERESALPGATPGTEAPGEHHYHHHYHHHYFSATDGTALAGGPDPRVASGNATGREPVRMRAPLSGPSLSRAESALRKVAQDWALACNTKQLDDLVDLYNPDAMVLRSNVPAVRGAAAIRELFFGQLEAGMSEVELEPLRTEMFGDFGYEAGRCKSLVPVVMGKRREERGKYMLFLNRQANGEWRILADSWSSDLNLGVTAELAKTSGPPAGLVPRPPRKP
jgi:ketosteroid isomerase-like protein